MTSKMFDNFSPDTDDILDNFEFNRQSPDFPVIRVRNFSFAYGQKLTLDDISIDITQNQVTAIIGSSGCGKSTFLKSLNRVAELEGKVQIKGKIDFLGQNIYSRNVNVNRLRRQIGMVFQRPNPFPMSIYDNIAYGVRLIKRFSRDELDEIVELALTDVALWEEVKNTLGKSALDLSGGQQQRLCIARALAVQPKVLLMDEPCSALDPISTGKIEDLINDLKAKLTIVMVTHNMQQAARVADYTAFFNTDETRIGQLVEFGKTENIFGMAINSATRDYVSGRFG
jgi:phosphate transport system ATP-binding protein